MEMQRRKYLAAIGATVSGLTLAGCSEGDSGDSGSGNVNDNGGDNSGGDSNSGNSGSNDQPDVELLDHEFYEEDFSSGVRGTAVNNTDSELSYVEANATFFDSEGTRIGDGVDNVTDLAGGREWAFDCLFLGEDASSIEEYEIEVTTGF